MQRAGLGRLAKQDGFQLWNEAQKRTLIFVPRSIVAVVGPQEGFFVRSSGKRGFTEADAVIRGLFSFPPSGRRYCSGQIQDAKGTSNGNKRPSYDCPDQKGGSQSEFSAYADIVGC
jgi:hypothetical protein